MQEPGVVKLTNFATGNFLPAFYGRELKDEVQTREIERSSTPTSICINITDFPTDILAATSNQRRDAFGMALARDDYERDSVMTLEAHTILVVDDDDQSREALSELLNQMGLLTVQAGNGKEALEQLHRMEPPALILLDMNMPVMDGWAFLREHEQDPELSGIPVVVVTGMLLERPISVPVLHKPLGLERLEPLLQRYCGTTW
jgi:CheY-like chemotaxis protein